MERSILEYFSIEVHVPSMFGDIINTCDLPDVLFLTSEDPFPIRVFDVQAGSGEEIVLHVVYKLYGERLTTDTLKLPIIFAEKKQDIRYSLENGKWYIIDDATSSDTGNRPILKLRVKSKKKHYHLNFVQIWTTWTGLPGLNKARITQLRLLKRQLENELKSIDEILSKTRFQKTNK